MSANDVTTLLRVHAPHAPERLRTRVLALEPRRSTAPSRKLVLVVVPAVLLIAVAAALVHGALRSGKPAAVAPQWKSFTAHGSAASTTSDSLRAAAVPKAAAVPNAAAAPAISSSRLQHTDASLRLRVGSTDALSQATSRATQIAASLGGYAKSVHYASSGSATLDLRVPADQVKTAITRLSALGTIVSQELSVTDLQDRFRTEAAQVAQLRRRIAALRTAVADPSLPAAQRVLLRIKLAESKRALAQRLNAEHGTVKAAANATISLVIGTSKAIAPPPQPRGRIGRMLHSALGFLALEGIVVLYALIVVSPFALAALLVWLWRRRSVDRLLST